MAATRAPVIPQTAPEGYRPVTDEAERAECEMALRLMHFINPRAFRNGRLPERAYFFVPEDGDASSAIAIARWPDDPIH